MCEDIKFNFPSSAFPSVLFHKNMRMSDDGGQSMSLCEKKRGLHPRLKKQYLISSDSFSKKGKN